MEIEFDPAKSERNRQARGFGFERASAFDFSTALIWIDSRNAYPETRYAALGLVDDRLHALVFTEAKSGIRVISFRKANAREIRLYARHR
jgi:uncharacterized DUF497 family protein